MRNDRSRDELEILGEYLRDRKPSHEEEQSVLDRLWKELRSERERPAQGVLRDINSMHKVFSIRRPIWAVAAAGVVLAVVLGVLVQQNAKAAVVERADGTLQRLTGSELRTIRAGERLAFGEPVRSGSGTDAMLALNDGSQIEVRSNSELVLEKAEDGVRIRLHGGGVLVTAAKQRSGHLYVQTKEVTVAVVGTVFLVNAEEAGSRVAVIQGEVQVQQGPTVKRLLPGEQVATNPLMESHPVREQVSWSRSSEGHVALLRQSAVAPIARQRLEFDTAAFRPGQSFSTRQITRVRCRGVDGEVSPVSSSAPAVPQGRCVGDNVPLMALVETAYGIEQRRVSGLPAPQAQPTYQIEARAEDPSTATKEDLRQMLESLLINRLKLRAHLETREMEGYVLRVGKDGVKFRETSGDEEVPQGRPAGPPQLGAGQALPTIVKGRFSLKRFAEFLSSFSRLPVIDRTDLSGIYEMNLTIDLILPPITAGAGGRGSANTGAPQEFNPPLPKAFEEQLGLRLESAKVPVEYLVVDHVEKLSEN